MAKNRGWWDLELKGNTSEELSDLDRIHIGEQIRDGFTSGEIVKDDECNNVR